MLVAAAAMVIAVNVGDLRWEEFVGGEINPAEQLGIVAGSDALLLRNTEIVSGNHHLDVPFDLYDGEDTDGGVNDLIGIFHAEASAVPSANAVGNSAARLAAAGSSFAEPGGQTHRLRYLHACFRQALYRILLQLIQRAVGAEYLDVAFAAVKHHVFAEYGKAGNGYRREFGKHPGSLQRRRSYPQSKSPCGTVQAPALSILRERLHYAYAPERPGR